MKSATSAIVLYIDGGPRNFQYLQSVTVTCSRVKQEKTYGGFLPQSGGDGGKSGPLFQMIGRTRKSYKGMIVCAFYKDGWDEASQSARWVTRAFMEPVFVSSLKEKQDMCTGLVINSVPALEKFRPRLFASIREICAALSSHALPKLKKKFQKTVDGLPLGQFTDVIFRQLFETFPKILDESEAPYTVAMLQEMFHQIDYNGDGACNWDEFTSFCVQTGLSAIANKKGNANTNYSLEQYVIEYGEEILQRDHILSPYRFVSLMRHVQDTRKLLIISEDSDYVLILDEKFKMHAQLYPSKVQVIGSTKTKAEREAEANSKKTTIRTPNNLRAMVYDVVYLSGRDLYAFTSSDHSITVCRELSSMEGMKVNYIQHNRFYHSLLHLKLCWSAKHNILCSVASDRVIYGWDIDTSAILFQISRHSDIITDFIAVDHLDVFITCSMDKRIVLWSSSSRRVKGVLQGHKRGVRCLSVFEHTLLSAGFECEANTWDLVNKDCVAILKGHRHPIVAAKLMCERAQTEREHRAITVDESGEFRLWNIFVRERASDPVPVPTIQIFEMQNSEHPLNQFRFLALPYNPKSSTSYYSNMIACSTKLMHFLPEKNMKEFVPPTACAVNEASALIVTAVGKNVLSYDLTHGEFSNIFENVSTSDVFAICMDGERGRRLYLGTGKGEVMLVNTMTGQFIDTVCYHEKEVTAIVQRTDLRNCIYSISMDGHIRMYDENAGKIHLQNSSEFVFGSVNIPNSGINPTNVTSSANNVPPGGVALGSSGGIGLNKLKHVPTLHVLVCCSAGKTWGILNDTTLKKLLVIVEEDVITAVEIIGASRDKEEEHMKSKANLASLITKKNVSTTGDNGVAIHNSMYEAPSLKENLLTIAIGLTKKVCIYTIDIHDMKGLKTYELIQEFHNFYITDLCLIKSPDLKSVNYAFIRSKSCTGEGSQLVASSDDGKMVVWDTETESLRIHCETKYRQHFKYLNAQARKPGKGRHGKGESDAQSTNTAANAKSGKPPSGGSSGVSGNLLQEIKQKEQARKEKEKKQEAERKEKERLEKEKHSHGHGHGHGHGGHGHGHGHHGDDHTIGSGSGTFLTASDDHVSVGSNGSQMSMAQTIAMRTKNSGKRTPLPTEQVIKTWIESTSNDFFPVALSGKTKKGAGNMQVLLRTTLSPARHWTGHHDIVSFMIPLDTHSCFVTISHDGYHRVWNLDAECLGEMVLPNITEQMKNLAMCKDPGTQWRFILERIPVTKHHQEIAGYLVRQLRLTRQEKILEHQQQQQADAQRRQQAKDLSMSIKGLRDAMTPENDQYRLTDIDRHSEQAKLRTDMLKSLTAPPEPAVDVPPERLPTKEEKELIKLSLLTTKNLHAASLAASSFATNPELAGSSVPMDSLETGLPAGSQSQLSLDMVGMNLNGSTSLLEAPSSLLKSPSLERAGTRGSTKSAPGSTTKPGTASSAKSPSGRASGRLSPIRSGTPGESILMASRQSKREHEKELQLLQEKTLRNSNYFNGDSGVCMSVFGVPSLWTVPGEKDIFGNTVSISSTGNLPELCVAPAFSEQSINALQREGLIDTEGRQILRRIANNSDRVQVYDRSQPTLLIRNPTMSTSISLPNLEQVRSTEISFGAQKVRYRTLL